MATDALHSRPAVECLADAMEKPLLDNRTYRVIKLSNELEALLIHDDDTDKASAAMDVNIGSFSDDLDMPGMAHAVEHLLFMGTEKYPGENDYSSYLAKYGGYSNAFTASTDTNYYFELSASATSNSASNSSENLAPSSAKSPLYGALDRFSQFFIHPLFSEGTLDRELQAVDSENKKNLQSDMWRLHQLNKSLSSQKHPFSKFSTGNYKVLHDDPIKRGVKIRDEFIKFYKKNYSANRMKLVVLGRESLDELQSWVEELFTAVPNQELPQLRWDDVPIFTEEEVCTQIFAKPVMESRMLDLHFPYPDEDPLYESQPGRYLSHLIGHEGPGSILAYLKAKGWANSLSAGASPMCPGSALFSIDIRLTEDGLKHYQEVVKVFFQYVAMLKEEPPHQWIVDEMKRLGEVDFKFKQKIPASRTTSHLSGIMQKPYPRNSLLTAQSIIRKFDAEGILRGLGHLRPDNFRMTIVSQDYPGDWNEKEKWYGTDYKCEKIPKDLMQEYMRAYKSSSGQRPSELHLPAKNEFIPQRLDVEKKEVEKPSTTPTLIRNEENVRTWFKKDDQFWVPKANIYVTLRSPVVNVTPLAAVMTQVYRELVEDSLVEYSYDAELAGLQYGISDHGQGLDVTVSGYNDKMAVLLEKVLVSMRDLEVKQERFDIIKERLLRGFRNFEYQDPFRQISTYSRWLVTERGWSHNQLLDELPSVTADDVRAFFPQILKQMHIEVLVHGNLYKEDALRVSDLVESTMKPKRLPAAQWPTRRSLLLPAGSDFRYEHVLKNPDNVNHCIEYIIFAGSDSDRPLRAKLLLLGQITSEPCFDTLRTKEQLGYVVGSGALVFNTVLAYRVLIQSEKNCEYLEKRIDAFLIAFEDTIKNMPDNEFEEHKISLINKRLEKLKNLSQETSRFWHHVTSEMFDFELVHRDVKNIEPLTKQDMLDFYRELILPGSPHRSKASVHLVAQASADTIAVNTDPAEQKMRLVTILSKSLTQLGIQPDNAALATRLDKVDFTGGDSDGILAAVGGYLKETAGIAAEQIEQVLAQGKIVLAQALPSIGIKPNGTDTIETAPTEEKEKTKTIIIDDVKAFKASMPLGAGAKPVRDLSEFEELEPKL
ncbi:putative zinc protease [Acrodontium crateriforme]|uniref:Zinc protease n=1 Tax=Acrodontium crateriforme TaxID=150365 RepID=A0AAQ3MB88_9PEZI|nr:putative zinc protease [Acrodontium crateriforme]